VVLPAEEAHGLEFDAVVVVEPAAIAAGRSGLRTLYVALTRPTRRLALVYSQDLPAGLSAGLAAAAHA
jgi:DNA helicase IV